MTRYVLQRAAQAVALLALVSLVGYAIMNLAPGGPLAVYMHNPQVTPERIAILRHQLGFDRPWYARYVVWAGALLRGQWGDADVLVWVDAAAPVCGPLAAPAGGRDARGRERVAAGPCAPPGPARSRAGARLHCELEPLPPEQPPGRALAGLRSHRTRERFA